MLSGASVFSGHLGSSSPPLLRAGGMRGVGGTSIIRFYFKERFCCVFFVGGGFLYVCVVFSFFVFI